MKKIIAPARTFDSRVQTIGTFNPANDQDMKNEPMFFNCDLDYAYEQGGLITRSFIDSLPSEWKSGSVFDSRVHMLMKGWYPCIPGWHHDDVARDPELGGQPNYFTDKYKSQHIVGLVNAQVCPTLFINGNCSMPQVEEGDVIYRKWNDVCETILETNPEYLVTAESNVLYLFDNNCFHTGQRAIDNGWRWFGRVSRNTERTQNITNEIRRQVQVYLEFPTQGW